MTDFIVKFVGFINLCDKTHFRMEVEDHNNNRWSIYRRYSEFYALNIKINALLGAPKVKTLGLNFPDKTLGSTWKPVIDSRMVSLNTWLQLVLSLDEFSGNDDISSFLDSENKGISGLQKQYGQQKIVKESFAKTKYNKPFLFPAATNFIILLKTGEYFSYSSAMLISLSFHSITLLHFQHYLNTLITFLTTFLTQLIHSQVN